MRYPTGLKNIYVIILTLNKVELVVECIKSVQKSRTKHLIRTIVVDNASTDGTKKIIEEKFPGITVLRNKSNIGWTGGNNKGIKYALRKGADVIILLNNDLVIDKDCINELVNGLYVNNENGITGPKILDKSGNKIKNAGYIMGADYNSKPIGVSKNIRLLNNNRYVDFVSGSAMAVKRELFEKVGMFDDKFFIYYEEADFCFRARLHGFRSMTVGKAIVYHEEGATTGLDSPFHTYFNTRNRLLFIEKRNDYIALGKSLCNAIFIFIRKLFHRDRNSLYVFLGLTDYILRRFNKRWYWGYKL